VCPNDAFFRLPTPDDVDIDGRQQYFVFAELCNECGNCMVFCPEDGDPAQVKPKLYLDAARFESATGPAFHLGRANGDLAITAKPGLEAEIPLLRRLLTDQHEGIPTG
jgi:putative selenate reductase